MNQYDIIIIGAGIAGSSIAAALSGTLSKQSKILLLDMESMPGLHATGRSAAFYSPSYGNKIVRAITKAGDDFFRSPPAGFSEAQLLRPRPALFIATRDQLDAAKQQRNEDDQFQRISGDEARRMVGILKPESIVEGNLDNQGGDLNVDALLQGYLRVFSANGGELRTGTAIDNITFNDDIYLIKSRDLEFKTPLLVNAAGAWADNIAVMAGLEGVGIKPLRRTALLVDAPSQFDIEDWPLVIDVEENFYFKPDAGQLLISPADESPMDACDAYPDEFDMAVAIDRIQQVAKLQVTKINHSWAGLRSFAPDRCFVTGFDPRQKGFFWLAGQGGYGVQSAPGLADIANYMITGNHKLVSKSAIETFRDALAPERFF